MFKLFKLATKKKQAKKAYKNYTKNESSPLLRRFAAEAHRERVRDIDKDFKQTTKTN
jgi:hypothetical protein